MKIVKIPEDALLKFLDENSDGLSEAEFAERYLKGVAATLIRQPDVYRTYGAHWWPLKRLLVAGAMLPMAYGDSYNTEANALFSESTDALTVCAAFLAQQDNVSDRMMSDTRFVYEKDDGEAFEFLLEDDEMEKIIFAAKIAPLVS
jgi:hypothetical protein